ncbi:MAG: plasmid pRiA4b ORF-3 family protein [Chlorobi bacterium]|nr:plasmid pRiA4b ORF-3 family protein [Chlorobiota bacterium]
MVLYIRLLSHDVEDFVMEVAVNSDATFMDLHSFLQKELGFDPSNMASFVITDSDWNRQKEISLVKMNEDDDSVVLMEEASLGDYLKNRKQRLMYVFDFFSERAFFMEVFEIREGVLKSPELLKKEGKVPPQIAIDDNLTDDDLGLGGYEDEFGDEFDDIDALDPDNFPDDF